MRVSRQCLSLMPVVLYEAPSQARGCILCTGCLEDLFLFYYIAETDS